MSFCWPKSLFCNVSTSYDRIIHYIFLIYFIIIILLFWNFYFYSFHLRQSIIKVSLKILFYSDVDESLFSQDVSTEFGALKNWKIKYFPRCWWKYIFQKHFVYSFGTFVKHEYLVFDKFIIMLRTASIRFDGFLFRITVCHYLSHFWRFQTRALKLQARAEKEIERQEEKDMAEASRAQELIAKPAQPSLTSWRRL